MRRLAKAELLGGLAVPAACLMCELSRAREPIASSEHAIAILDRFASRPGHVLVIARRHEDRVAHLSYREYEGLHRLVYEVCGAVERVLAPRRIYVAALGSAVPLATSSPHVHIHVVPLADGGEADRPAEVFTWAHGAYVFESDDEERELRTRLRAGLATEPG